MRDGKTRTLQERASWDIEATHWDLPGDFVIASEDHPFVAKGASGKEYVYDFWCSLGEAINIMKRKG